MLSLPSTTNAQDWDQRLIVEDDVGDPFDLSGCLIDVEIRDPNGCGGVAASTADGSISIEADGFRIFVPAAGMRGLREGTYAATCRITAPAGGVSQPFVTSISIVEGGFR